MEKTPKLSLPTNRQMQFSQGKGISASGFSKQGEKMESPQPSFYAIIPATVRYNKNIEANAKLLYGEITALANQCGYCWATDCYFASLYDVDERTVKRWIQSLKNEKLIKVETDRTSFPSKRKIWITPEIQKIFTSGQKCPDHRDKNVPPINTHEYKKKNSIKRKTKNAAAPIVFDKPTRSFQGITSEDIAIWQKTFPSVNIRKTLDECAIWAYDNERQNYRKSIMSFIKYTEKSHTEPFREPPEPQKEVSDTDIAQNKKIASEVQKKALAMNLSIHYSIHAGCDKIGFIMPEGGSYEVNYNLPHEEFKRKCLPALKRMRMIK